MRKRWKTKMRILSYTASAVLVASCLSADENTKSKPEKETVEETPKKVIMEEKEWKKKLTSEQFRILRQAGTERPFGDVYNEFKN